MGIDGVELRKTTGIPLIYGRRCSQPQLRRICSCVYLILYLKQHLAEAFPAVLVHYIVDDGITQSIVLGPLGGSPLQGISSDRSGGHLPHNDVWSQIKGKHV